jgi:hypothetical protein
MEQVNESSTWRKASYSGNGGANCIEVADTASAVLIRDTKDNGRGPVLRVTPEAWTSFTASLRLRAARGASSLGTVTLPIRGSLPHHPWGREPFSCPPPGGGFDLGKQGPRLGFGRKKIHA